MNIKNDYKLVLDLFNWVCMRREPSLEARCIVIHIAVVSKDLNMARKLITLVENQLLNEARSHSEVLKDILEVFNDFLEVGVPFNTESYNEGITPNIVTYTVLVHGLCEQGDVDTANELLHEVCTRGLELNVYTYNALLHGLCKVGNMVQAEMLVEDMEVAGVRPDTVTYTTLMDAYCKSGEINKAHQLLEILVKKKKYTEAKDLFEEMKRKVFGHLYNLFNGMDESGGRKMISSNVRLLRQINYYAGKESVTLERN
ncbi:hypothetical protein V2J09_004210 [Rumex salicifolius]